MSIKDIWRLYADYLYYQGLCDYFYAHSMKASSLPTHLQVRRANAKETLIRALLETDNAYCVTLDHNSIRDIVAPVYRPQARLTANIQALMSSLEEREVSD